MTLTAVSADSHVNEPPDLFVKRLPDGLRDRGPHCIDMPNGGQAWVFEDVDDPMPLGLTAVNFRAQKRFDRAAYKEKFLEYRDGVQRGVRYDDILPGSFDPVARLAEQDEDHVDAEILYASPNVWAGVKAGRDPSLRLACFQAYNDWMAEFTAVAPERNVGVGLIPNTGIDDAVAEMRRCVTELGLRSVAIESYPNGSATTSAPEDDRFWADGGRARHPRRPPRHVHVPARTRPPSSPRATPGSASRRPRAATRRSSRRSSSTACSTASRR